MRDEVGENVTSFGIKHDCNWLDLDKVSLKLASKNLVRSKLKPVLKCFLFYFKEKDFHMDCCKRKISEVLAARELYSLNCSLLAKLFFKFISARARKNLTVLACSRMLAKTIRHLFW